MEDCKGRSLRPDSQGDGEIAGRFAFNCDIPVFVEAVQVVSSAEAGSIAFFVGAAAGFRLQVVRMHRAPAGASRHAAVIMVPLQHFVVEGGLFPGERPGLEKVVDQGHEERREAPRLFNGFAPGFKITPGHIPELLQVARQVESHRGGPEPGG